MPFLRRFWNRWAPGQSPGFVIPILETVNPVPGHRREVLEEIELTTLRFEAELELTDQACKKRVWCVYLFLSIHRSMDKDQSFQALSRIHGRSVSSFSVVFS